jgi:hypothetical protein
MEEEFIRNQERLKPQEEKIEVMYFVCLFYKEWSFFLYDFM